MINSVSLLDPRVIQWLLYWVPTVDFDIEDQVEASPWYRSTYSAIINICLLNTTLEYDSFIFKWAYLHPNAVIHWAHLFTIAGASCLLCYKSLTDSSQRPMTQAPRSELRATFVMIHTGFKKTDELSFSILLCNYNYFCQGHQKTHLDLVFFSSL